MILRKFLVVLAAVAGLAAVAPVGAARAEAVAVATGNVNLRAGPSTGYPVITVVPVGARITTHGCLAGYSWCDVNFGAYRGWVAASYIQVVYNQAPVVLTPAVATAIGVTIVAFDRAYWDAYYPAYPWYGHWSRYYRPVPVPVAPPPRVTSYDRTLDCADGSCTGTRSATGVYGASTSQTRTCANGACTATRDTTGPRGYSTGRTRTCTGADRSCSISRH